MLLHSVPKASICPPGEVSSRGSDIMKGRLQYSIGGGAGCVPFCLPSGKARAIYGGKRVARVGGGGRRRGSANCSDSSKGQESARFDAQVSHVSSLLPVFLLHGVEQYSVLD